MDRENYKNDEYMRKLLENSTKHEEYVAVKKLWENAVTKETFELAMLETQDPILLGSEAYAKVFADADVSTREKYAKQMFDRIAETTSLTPQTATCVWDGATYSTVLLLDDKKIEIAIDEAATDFDSQYGVIVFDYTKVKPDQFACKYPFNRFMVVNGGRYYIHINHGVEGRVGFRKWTGGALIDTDIVLQPGHYMVCAISGFVFIAKI